MDLLIIIIELNIELMNTCLKASLMRKNKDKLLLVVINGSA